MDLSRIQYVVIVDMENRSFDHVLGYLNLPENHPKWDQINGIFEAMEVLPRVRLPAASADQAEYRSRSAA